MVSGWWVKVVCVIGQECPTGISIQPVRSPRNVKNVRFVSIGCVFSSSIIRQNSFSAAGGAYNAPPDPQVGWEGVHPLPFLFPLDAFGISIWPPTSLKFVYLALRSKKVGHPWCKIYSPNLVQKQCWREVWLLINFKMMSWWRFSLCECLLVYC